MESLLSQLEQYMSNLGGASNNIVNVTTVDFFELLCLMFILCSDFSQFLSFAKAVTEIKDKITVAKNPNKK